MAQVYVKPAWGKVKPRTRAQRYALAEKRPECFLFPEGTPASPGVPSYPICTAQGQDSCPGLLAAYRRLNVYGPRYSKYGPTWTDKVWTAFQEIVNRAERYADADDPANVCNFVSRARERLAIELRDTGDLGVSQPYIMQVLEREGRKWWPAGRYFFRSLQDARKAMQRTAREGYGVVIHDSYCLIEKSGINQSDALRWGTGTVNRLQRCSSGRFSGLGAVGLRGANMGHANMGQVRQCVRFKRARGGVKRCAKYAISGAVSGLDALTSKDRDRIRKLQDKLIKEALRRGIPLDMQVSVDTPGVTLKELQQYIYPEYENVFRRVLREELSGMGSGLAAYPTWARHLQPWEMTRQAFVESEVPDIPYDSIPFSRLEPLLKKHRASTVRAFNKGRPVPASVLMQYADLAAKAGLQARQWVQPELFGDLGRLGPGQCGRVTVQYCNTPRGIRFTGRDPVQC